MVRLAVLQHIMGDHREQDKGLRLIELNSSECISILPTVECKIKKMT